MAGAKADQSSRRKKHWRVILVTLLAILCVAFVFREKLERLIIAVIAERQHIFTPPPLVENEASWHRFFDEFAFYWDLSALRVERQKRLSKFNPVIKPILKDLVRRQAAGQSVAYSMNIYREIRWRLNFTPDTAATSRRIEDLRKSIDQHDLQLAAEQQRPSDCSFALGIEKWYLRLYYSVDQVKDSDSLKYPLRFLDQVNSPALLTARLDSDLYDKFTQTGTFNREELDETFSAMARLLNAGKPVAYPFNPQLKQALKDYISAWQNPKTGFWGQWMVDRRGHVWKMDDMAMTFHVISDFHGDVDHKDLIAKNLFRLEDIEFPAGVRFNGSYENHLNWDVVKIFKYAWPVLDTATRKKARGMIEKMLAWCLSASLKPDGAFRISDLDDTLGDAFFYGTSFLADAGYFDPKKCFWAKKDFPGAEVTRLRIVNKIKSIGLKDGGLRDAYHNVAGPN